MNRSKVQRIHDLIQKAVQDIAVKENVKIEFGSRRFDSLMYQTKLTVTDLSEIELINKKMVTDSKIVGFTRGIIGLEFEAHGTVYTIAEVKRANRKYPIIATNKSGKRYKFSVANVKLYMGGDKGVNRADSLNKLFADEGL